MEERVYTFTCRLFCIHLTGWGVGGGGGGWGRKISEAPGYLRKVGSKGPFLGTSGLGNVGLDFES